MYLSSKRFRTNQSICQWLAIFIVSLFTVSFCGCETASPPVDVTAGDNDATSNDATSNDATHDDNATEAVMGSDEAVDNGSASEITSSNQPLVESAGQSGNTISLFDGTFKDWEQGVFGASDECCIEEGCIVLEIGYPMSGIASYLEDLPVTNYEVSLEAKKMIGNDFFCALTFPVDDSHCTFVAGGWGGATTGLSCIDGDDASSNETKSHRKYETEQWYAIKTRVTGAKIEVWVDDEQVVDFDREGHTISLRAETNACKPLGIASFETRAAFRNFQLTTFSD